MIVFAFSQKCSLKSCSHFLEKLRGKIYETFRYNRDENVRNSKFIYFIKYLYPGTFRCAWKKIVCT
jgi:hypothetical protein